MSIRKIKDITIAQRMAGAGVLPGELAKLQSKYLYMQASGSRGTDGTARGFHLRWTFRDTLAMEHLPKGDLAVAGPFATTIMHNRPDDFVYLYRMDYNRAGAPEIDLGRPPHNIIVSIGKIEWRYDVPGFSGPVRILLRFLDPDLYQAAQNSADPLRDPRKFLAAYSGIIRIEFENSLIFGGTFHFTPVLPATAGHLLLEARSAAHGDPGAELSLACRKKLFCNAAPGCAPRIVCENIRYFDIRQENVVINKIKLEAYQDIYRSNPNTTLIDRFSLSVDDTQLRDRLEKPGVFDINGRWPQYNDGTTVKIANYEDKWWGGSDSIKVALEKYLTLSKTDIKAVETLPSDDGDEVGGLPVSYLSILNIIASDFHLARMLGLGHIYSPGLDPQEGFIYVATYAAKHQYVYSEENIPSNTVHLVYMSLPTTLDDDRLPARPAMREIRYGLNIEGPAAEAIFDENGYSKLYDVRFVNIGRKKYDYEVPLQPFFATDTEFCTCQYSEAILYGIEYKGADEAHYRKPEITSLPVSEDTYFAWDPDRPEGVPETILVSPADEDLLQAPGKRSLYVHHESEEGVHCYAIYGVNWFSRASPVSEEKCTDETLFPKKNTIKPPANLSVQYIQKEDTLIFTTQEEQQELAAREAANPGADNSFTRVCFEYNHLHNIAYQRANKINFYFREQLPLEVRGKITSEGSFNGNEGLSILNLGSYNTIESGVVEPIIPASLVSRFEGGLLSAEGEHFVVHQVIPGNPYPRIVVERIIRRQVISGTQTDPDTGETVTVYQNTPAIPLCPKPGQRFLLAENLSAPAQWTKLAKQIDIIHFSDYTEQEVAEGGTETTLTMGGITGNANIVPSTSIPGISGIAGVSRVSFQSQVLVNHPDNKVSWYKGTARLVTASGKMRALEVMRIETQSPLVIWVYDSEYETDPVVAGTNRPVNFHPGYRLYLYPESATQFDKAHIEPVSGLTKKSLMGVQAINTNNTPPHGSAISIPAVLLAQRIVQPLPPTVPIGPLFATRPDFYGKSTYTFDVEINTSGGRSPFGLVFFRANDTAVMEALYIPATIGQIEEQLKDLPTQEFAMNRFHDLVNVVLDPDPAHATEFKEYDGYRLPVPDKPGLVNTNDTVAQRQSKLKNAIDKVFVPLTEGPPLFEFIKTGRTTAGTPPVIKDSNGDLLDHSAPTFNPFPMVRKFTANGKTFVRFTDYTLDGSAVNKYFYYAMEISPQLVMSSRSPVSGPILLVNAYPPEAPSIKTILPQIANPVDQKATEVFFQVEPYLANDRVEKINVYRTTNPERAKTVQTMTLAATCHPDAITDNFADLPFPPFGDLIYYRLVALRRILNEQGREEWIPSRASDLFMTNIIDVTNPEAPDLAIDFGQPAADHALPFVNISWSPTCYNGTYHLYKMTRKGGWEKIFTVKSNKPVQFPPAGDFTTWPQTKLLQKVNEDGQLVYHRFKVDVVNAAGLINLETKEKSI